MDIIKITQADFNEWLDLAMQLWSDNSIEEMHASLTTILQSPREAAFLARAEDGSAIAFMNLSLRHDYVPGATQSPVAYIEGIYVKENYRKQGLGKALIQYAEQWAVEQGCTQLASDALLENTESYEFHTHIGFEEVERVVCFIKPVVASH
ncbi:MAG: GNAT family N-acetyltransferase [Leptolyngbya sp. UWPOB_LEPTO1]|uniref:aminoglycoside 6'-N-acetyltransferase n=1 Tax=Leptolyngbya sp. UWPOB_LEPTO1 TaxID=2815653 RepID=UPI001ACA816A|nr:aminoglycoside 6'-N-acetyltransferase [Leptolyngbya sp. UWPOB_LEPTO1]MBN8563578.1 GNAT family N-acetyltransferase [Leptolyngbya sp. UWPOB_LEPTO1]